MIQAFHFLFMTQVKVRLGAISKQQRLATDDDTKTSTDNKPMHLTYALMSEISCIHVGLHKCASTLFQNHIFPKHPGVGLISGRSSSDKAILPPKMRKFNNNVNAMGGMFDYPETETALRQAAKEFDQDKTIVLSDESYSGDLCTGRNAQTKAEVFREVLGKVKVLVVLRDQYEYLLSVWREYVSSGGV